MPDDEVTMIDGSKLPPKPTDVRESTDKLASSDSLTAAPEHDTHVWKRGMLPGGKYIKTCSVGGEMEDVDFETWQTLG